MTEETPHNRTRRPRPVPPDGAAPAPATPDADDPDAALRRLESMGSGRATPAAANSEPVPPSPAVDAFSAPPPARSQRPLGSSSRTPKARPRPAGGSRSTQMIARVAAPVVFLIAVIALIGIVVDSGVLDADRPVATPTVKATKADSGAKKTTRKYVIKSGDSLSGLAERFHTTTSALQDLNPDLSGSTLVVGQRIVVPVQ